MTSVRFLALACWLAAAALGCGGVIGDEPGGGPSGGVRDGARPGQAGNAGDRGDGTPGSNDGDGSDDGSGPGAADAEGQDGSGASAACLDAVFQASSAPLRRLSAREYQNSVEVLLPGVALPTLEVVADVRQEGFDNAASGQAPSPLAVEQYERAAKLAASAALAQLDSWAPCSADTATCAQQVVLDFAARAYRRPLASAERDTLQAFVQGALADATPLEVIGLGLEALLQSPYFLYRPEFGTQTRVGDAAVALDGYEMASRLSYFFLATMPDTELMDAAASGALDAPEGVTTQARRLLTDPRAHDVLVDFLAQWLGLHRIDELSLDPNIFPELDAALRDDLQASALRYVEHALWEADSWAELIGGRKGFVNDRLAPLFGVPAPGSDTLVEVALDAGERRGVLTQPGVLASTSHGIRHSPILRGVTVLDRILCRAPPAPPPGVLAMNEALPVDEDLICTTRDEVALKHTQRDECAGCHTAIDGAGFNFEHYDALGRYRSEENGCAIDASGSFPGTDIADVRDAVELAAELVSSASATECFSEQLFRFALGRGATPEDQCEIGALGALLQGDDSLQNLIIELVKTPSFRSRPAMP